MEGIGWSSVKETPIMAKTLRPILEAIKKIGIYYLARWGHFKHSLNIMITK